VNCNGNCWQGPNLLLSNHSRSVIIWDNWLHPSNLNWMVHWESKTTRNQSEQKLHNSNDKSVSKSISKLLSLVVAKRQSHNKEKQATKMKRGGTTKWTEKMKKLKLIAKEKQQQSTPCICPICKDAEVKICLLSHKQWHKFFKCMTDHGSHSSRWPNFTKIISWSKTWTKACHTKWKKTSFQSKKLKCSKLQTFLNNKCILLPASDVVSCTTSCHHACIITWLFRAVQ